MLKPSRLARIWVGSAVATFALTGIVLAQDATQRPPNTQLPKQVLPTGAEDAPAAIAARRGADAAKLERKLVRMTSQSDEGLEAEPQRSGGYSANLRGTHMSVLIATPTRDGGTEISCLTGAEALEKVKQAELISAGKAPKPPKSAPPSPPQSAPAVPEEK